MNLHIEFHSQIRSLRADGFTYSEINAQLGTKIPKSSMSYICKGINLTTAQSARIDVLMKDKLALNRQKAVLANRKIQEMRLKNMQKRNLYLANLSDREAKIALAFLYLGEGSKRTGFRGLALGSSDPNIIVLYMGLLKKCYSVEANEFKCRVLYRADQNLHDLEKFWSETTKIPRDNFYKTKPDSRTVGKPTLHSDYKGVCVLFRRGADIQLELQVITDIIGETMGM
jgi:hypothetical protein